MDAYIGHRFEVRVTEQPSGKEVGRKTITSLDSNSASLLLYVFLQGRNYNVDFYADVNNNESYDAPPTDNAWRRIINNVSDDKVVDFSPDNNYTAIGFPDAFPYGYYDAIWGGKWKNLTFGSTDSIMASFQLRCDSVFGTFMTKGVFGNPAPVTFNYAGAVPPDSVASDTIKYTVPAPWSGEVIVVNGDITGNLNLAGTGLTFKGTLGEKQILCLYTVVVGGNPFANGYFYVRELSIMDSYLPIHIDGTVQNISCAGAANGFIQLNISGGTGNYEYWWDPTGQTTPYIDISFPGDFIVTVNDELGCSAIDTFTVSEPDPINIQIIKTNPSCHGSCDGAINLIVTGGIGAPYVYEVSSGSFVNLCAGQYSVTVTDASGCTAVNSVNLTDPVQISLTGLIVIQPTNGQNNGSIEVPGNLPGVTFSLDGINFSSNHIFTNLGPGTYIVYFKDAQGCIGYSDEIILQDISAVNELNSYFSFYPNPVFNEVHIDSDVPLSVELLDVQGRMLEIEDFNFTHKVSMVNFSEGIYFLKISDGEKYAFRKIVKAKG